MKKSNCLHPYQTDKVFYMNICTYFVGPLGSQRPVHRVISTSSSEDGSLAQSDASGSANPGNSVSGEIPSKQLSPKKSNSITYQFIATKENRERGFSCNYYFKHDTPNSYLKLDRFNAMFFLLNSHFSSFGSTRIK